MMPHGVLQFGNNAPVIIVRYIPGGDVEDAEDYDAEQVLKEDASIR